MENHRNTQMKMSRSEPCTSTASTTSPSSAAASTAGRWPRNEPLSTSSGDQSHRHRRPDSYTRGITVATSRVEVGVRDLKNNLSRYLEHVKDGEEVIVTDRGKPVARLAALDHSTDRLAELAELIAAGVVRPAKRSTRIAPKRRIKPRGSVSDLVAEQRR
jgi:prevent-host-death family protein